MDRRVALITLALCAPSGVASAEPACGGGHSLTSQTCVGWAGLQELDEALSTELGPRAAPGVRVVVEPETCEPNATHFAIELGAGGKTSRKTIDLSDAPSAGRPRVLALLIAELARAMCSPSTDGAAVPAPIDERGPLPAPRTQQASPPPAPPASSPSTRGAITDPVPHGASEASSIALGASAAFDVRAFPSFSASLVGGRAGLDLGAARWLGASVDGVALHGSTRDLLGTVDLTSYGVGLTVGGRAGVGARHRFGLRTDFLWTTASGVTSRPDVVTSDAGRLAIMTGAEARLEFPIGDLVRGTASVLAGGVVRGLYGRVAERTAAGVAGPMVGIAIGLAIDAIPPSASR